MLVTESKGFSDFVDRENDDRQIEGLGGLVRDLDLARDALILDMRLLDPLHDHCGNHAEGKFPLNLVWWRRRICRCHRKLEFPDLVGNPVYHAEVGRESQTCRELSIGNLPTIRSYPASGLKLTVVWCSNDGVGAHLGNDRGRRGRLPARTHRDQGHYDTKQHGDKLFGHNHAHIELFRKPPMVTKEQGGISPGPRNPTSLLKHEYFLLRAHLLQDLRPYRDADFAEMRLAQQQHQRARLPDAAADREGICVVEIAW